MTITRYFRCMASPATVLVFLALFAAVTVQGQAHQNITVRFLNFKSGKPIKHLNVEITLWNGHSTGTSVAEVTIISKVSGKTDRDGKLTIDIPEDFIPEHISIFALDLVQPAGPRLSPSEVLRGGVVVPYRYGKSKPTFQASAQTGEIVILDKKLTAMDRMLQEIP